MIFFFKMPGMVLNGMIALKSNVFWPRVHFTIKFIRSCVLYWMHNAQSSPRKINIQLQIRLLWNFLFKMIGWKKFLRKSATVVSWGEFKWKCCYVEPLRLNIPNLLLCFVCLASHYDRLKNSTPQDGQNYYVVLTI